MMGLSEGTVFVLVVVSFETVVLFKVIRVWEWAVVWLIRRFFWE